MVLEQIERPRLLLRNRSCQLRARSHSPGDTAGSMQMHMHSNGTSRHDLGACFAATRQERERLNIERPGRCQLWKDIGTRRYQSKSAVEDMCRRLGARWQKTQQLVA